MWLLKRFILFAKIIPQNHLKSIVVIWRVISKPCEFLWLVREIDFIGFSRLLCARPWVRFLQPKLREQLLVAVLQ